MQSRYIRYPHSLILPFASFAFLCQIGALSHFPMRVTSNYAIDDRRIHGYDRLSRGVPRGLRMPCDAPDMGRAVARARGNRRVLKLRLTRTGSKDKAQYRIIVVEAASKRDGRFVENIGYYNPRTEPSTIVVKLDRADYWMKNGAQPTESVASILKRARATSGDGVATPAVTTGAAASASTTVATAPVVATPVAALAEPVAVTSVPVAYAPIETAEPADAPVSDAASMPASTPESAPATAPTGA